MTSLPGAYRPGTTLLHRTPAGPSLALLAAYGALTVILTGWQTSVALLAFSLALAFAGGLRIGVLARRLRVLLVLLVAVSAYQSWQRSWEVAVHLTGDLLALVVAALTLTATTRTEDLLNAMTRGISPLRRLGVPVERVALAFSLVVSAVPTLLLIATETRDAARARGLERNPRAFLVPMTLRTVGHALETGEALHARGIVD